MKALLSIEPGKPDTLVLRDVPTPEPGRGELRVRVIACAVNYPDVLIIEDRYQFKPPRPFATGFEITGVVEGIGDDVDRWSRGDRLIAVIPYGGLAEQAIVRADRAIPLPKDRNPIEGAGLIFTYGTTIHALIDRGALKRSETLLVLGAAGGSASPRSRSARPSAPGSLPPSRPRQRRTRRWPQVPTRPSSTP
jgi:NADPH:quinone reductase